MDKKTIMIDMDEVIVVGNFSNYLIEFLGKVDDILKNNKANDVYVVRSDLRDFKIFAGYTRCFERY